jgi:hypothetical protein
MWREVREALMALPTSFRSDTFISGIRATDIFTLNSVLAATIEDQVVASLNDMRNLWDPEGRYKAYRFVRQSQTFPDVLLKRRVGAGKDDILFGIELKGWYLLSKEREPSLRLLTDPDACATADLVAVVPWALSSVLSGKPVVYDPYVELARYASEHKNYWWSEVRKSKGSKEIRRPHGAAPYPRKADQVADQAVDDSGSNFGRLARTGLLDDFVSHALEQEIAGVSARVWINFFHGVDQAPPQSTPQTVELGPNLGPAT